MPSLFFYPVFSGKMVYFLGRHVQGFRIIGRKDMTMSIFDVLTLIGGLCLFLFGMNVMGAALERSAGGKLELLLARLTTGKLAGLLTGLAVTGVIQSSSATTVMVVGFVNSGLMTLRQAINVIMGANIGTTVTAWILSLGGIESGSLFLQLLKPASFTPILALVGIVFYMFCKDNKKKDIGVILLGFATLMYGMESMTDAVSGLADVPEFQKLFLLFENPILGVLAGAILTAVIQSSSASVGILQALSATGQVTLGAAIPIIMGQNIGTCITAILSSFGTNKNAKRAALVHLSFNVIGTVVWLTVFAAADALFQPALFDGAATRASIATAHSMFNIACTCLLLPASSLLEKLAYKLVPDTQAPNKITMLDERLLATPAVALERCHTLAAEMTESAVAALKDALTCLFDYSAEKIQQIRQKEDFTDRCEDKINGYLVKLSANAISDAHSTEAAALLKVIGDLERIGDHAVNLAESAEELNQKKMKLTPDAQKELENLCDAVNQILDLSSRAFVGQDLNAAATVEPLEEVIDELKDKYRSSHIKRLQHGQCSIEAGFVWSDILTNLERTADHCCNIAGSVMDGEKNKLHTHGSAGADSQSYKMHYDIFVKEYLM